MSEEAVTENPNGTDALFEEYFKTKDTTMRNNIAVRYLNVVDILIRKYLNKGIDYDDLYQVGSMALLLAVERFDPSKGYEFSSFATPTIIGEIKRYFRDKGWAMKVPRKLKDIAVQLQPIKEQLHSELSRAPTIPEISQRMGYSEEEILEAMEIGQNYHAFSLSQSSSETGEREETAGLERMMGTREVGYDEFENRDLVRSILDDFTEKEREIFRRRLVEGRTQQQVAEDLGVSQMTVSRTETEIRNRFRMEFYK